MVRPAQPRSTARPRVGYTDARVAACRQRCGGESVVRKDQQSRHRLRPLTEPIEADLGARRAFASRRRFVSSIDPQSDLISATTQAPHRAPSRTHRWTRVRRSPRTTLRKWPATRGEGAARSRPRRSLRAWHRADGRALRPATPPRRRHEHRTERTPAEGGHTRADRSPPLDPPEHLRRKICGGRRLFLRHPCAGGEAPGSARFGRRPTARRDDDASPLSAGFVVGEPTHLRRFGQVAPLGCVQRTAFPRPLLQSGLCAAEVVRSRTGAGADNAEPTGSRQPEWRKSPSRALRAPTVGAVRGAAGAALRARCSAGRAEATPYGGLSAPPVTPPACAPSRRSAPRPRRRSTRRRTRPACGRRTSAAHPGR